MGSHADILKVDGTNYPLAQYFNDLFKGVWLANLANTETLTATKELTDDDYQLQLITASGADRTVELAPEASSNHVTIVYNAGGANNVPIKDDSGVTTFATIYPGQWALCIPTGTTWLVIPISQSISWSPTPTNLTIGNGTVVGRYTRIGRLVAFQYGLTFGSTTSVSGNVSFPVPIASLGGLGLSMPIGHVRFKDATGGAVLGVAQLQTNDVILPLALDSSGTYTAPAQMAAAVPFTWAQSDDFEMSGIYFA